MNIKPLATNLGGNPAAGAIGSSTIPSISKQAKQAAEQAFNGQVPVKITESDTPTDPRLNREKQNLRKITMNTNASPDRFDPTLAPTEDPVRTRPDNNEQAEAVLEDTKPISPQFAALAKQRRALQVRERELADRELAIKSRPSADTDLVARLKSQPLSVLAEVGVTYDQLTEAILANPVSNPEIQELRNELKALKEGVDKNLTDRDTAQEQAVLSDMRREAVGLASEGDAYEMVRTTKSIPEVIDLIHRTYKTTGEILDVPEAMQLVEDDLINEGLKVANFKKARAKLIPDEPVTQQQLQPRPMRTLPNRDGASTPASRRERAIAAMYGTLKK